MTGGLIVSGLSVTLGGRPILREVGFAAPKGKVTGLIGPNGAGKSTLIGTVAGLHGADKGTISFAQTDLLTVSRRERAKRVAYVEQSAGTEERLSLRDVVALGRIPHQSAFALEDRQDAAIIDGAIGLVGLEGLAGRQFNTLSGGEQQRAQIARALAQEPQLFLLDEPTSHLDIRAQIEVLALLRSLAVSGTTVLLALHDLNLALRHCDWLVAMGDGRVVAEGAPGDVLTSGLLADLYGVTAVQLNGPLGPVIAFEGVI